MNSKIVKWINLLMIIGIFIFGGILFSVDKVKIEYFGRNDCKNCVNLKKYFNELESKRSDFEVIEYKIDKNKEDKEFFEKVTDKIKLVKGTPIIYIDGNIIQGFSTKETTGKEIEKLIDIAIKKEKNDTLNEYLEKGEYNNINSNGSVCSGEGECEIPGLTKNKNEVIINIPFVNKTVNLSKYSLPSMSFILGTVDGVNPCAMWVLILFLTALISVGNKKNMIRVAGLFILAEAIMYYLILNVWLYTWDFVGLDKIITPIVGIVGIIGGALFIMNFVKQGNELACKVTDFEKRAKIHKQITDIANKPFTLLTAIGIIGLALSVNVIEFACSIGIPQTFTKILQINEVSFIERQIYNFLYIIGYMIDDFIVFGLALFSASKLQLTSKYSKWVNLFGGIIMIILGIILIVKPSLLII